jgi:hypothetical protein
MRERDRRPPPSIDQPEAIVGGGWLKPTTAPTIASQAQIPGLPPAVRQLADQQPKLAVSPPANKE